jgi:signal transduction histidine kinase
MRPSKRRWPFGNRTLDVAWALFSLANLVAMAAFPDWETVPFHFIWVSLTLVYGFRVWRNGGTIWALAAVMLLTGLLLSKDVLDHTQPPDELTEVPLMAAMFVAMVWHARRRLGAMEELQRVSDENRHLLEREQRFVQDASHQLRTPITIALGHAELLARQNDRDDPNAEDAHIVVEELERLRRLADLLLRIVSAREGRATAREPIDIGVMVAETLRRWTDVAPRRWTIGRLDNATGPVDGDQLQMAIDELIQNAVAHTGPGDEIRLEVRSRDGHVIMSVADRGSGIAADDLDRIFERFARSDGRGDRGKGGVGLGLSFVKSVAEAHDGRVRAASVLGEGSVFELEIPIESLDQQNGRMRTFEDGDDLTQPRGGLKREDAMISSRPAPSGASKRSTIRSP